MQWPAHPWSKCRSSDPRELPSEHRARESSAMDGARIPNGRHPKNRTRVSPSAHAVVRKLAGRARALGKGFHPLQKVHLLDMEEVHCVTVSNRVVEQYSPVDEPGHNLSQQVANRMTTWLKARKGYDAKKSRTLPKRLTVLRRTRIVGRLRGGAVRYEPRVGQECRNTGECFRRKNLFTRRHSRQGLVDHAGWRA